MISKSARLVASNDDLITEILLHLPVKSLLRFKSVSKRWRFIIDDTYFLNRRKNSVKGIIYRRLNPTSDDPELDFISFNNNNDDVPLAIFKSGLTIESSCNGLFLCTEIQNGKRNYSIYNPSTRKIKKLPDWPKKQGKENRVENRVHSVSLAFDPAKSSHYKVVLVVLCDDSTLRIEMYSSKTGQWRQLQQPLSRDYNYKLGVFCNGRMFWLGIGTPKKVLVFEVENERFREMQVPPLPEQKRVRYLQESNGHLHLIDINGPRTTRFKVYEMQGDYSGWFVKYEVDIEAVMNAFPEAVNMNLEASDPFRYKFLTLSIVRVENDEDSFLVLSVPGKIVRYSFADKSFKVIRDFGCDAFGSSLMIGWFDCFQFFESLSGV